MTAPLRFLSGVVGLWCLGRAGVLLWPDGAILPVAATASSPEVVLFATPAQAAVVRPSTSAQARVPGVPGELTLSNEATPAMAGAALRPSTRFIPSTSAQTHIAGAPAFILGVASPASPVEARSPAPFAVATPLGIPPRGSRPLAGVTVSSWALWRPGESGATSFGTGTLGGSQAGVRALLPILGEQVPRLALSARVSAPLRRRGAEAALGVEWQPSVDVPVKVLAERRQRFVGEGRSAFALLAHGGVSEQPMGGGFRLDAYGAAGVVGARSRDLFVEGAATVTRPVGPVRIGAGAWGGAQPGTARLDVGPTVALPLRLGGAGVRVSVDYRLRVAGAAAPGSGPALTIGTDF